MSSTGFAPLSVWLRKPRNLEGPEGHFFCSCAKLIIRPYVFLSKYILPYRSFLTYRSWILEYGFIFKIAFIRLWFHQHYNISIETFISTHVCLVPVAFSVHGRKCEFRWTKEVHAKQKTNYAIEKESSQKRANSSKILVLDKEVLFLKLTQHQMTLF